MKTFGRVGTKKSSGVNDHTIARTTDLLALQGRERRQSTVIRLLVDNVWLHACVFGIEI